MKNIIILAAAVLLSVNFAFCKEKSNKAIKPFKEELNASCVKSYTARINKKSGVITSTPIIMNDVFNYPCTRSHTATINTKYGTITRTVVMTYISVISSQDACIKADRNAYFEATLGVQAAADYLNVSYIYE
jgi:hypothetical protein